MRIFTLVLAATGISAPACADEFCEKLQIIVAAAPTDFAAIRGGGYVADYQRREFLQPLTLPGAIPPPPSGAGPTCTVAGLIGEPLYYGCVFPGSPPTNGIRAE